MEKAVGCNLLVRSFHNGPVALTMKDVVFMYRSLLFLRTEAITDPVGMFRNEHVEL